jgi:hypothetical protein
VGRFNNAKMSQVCRHRQILSSAKDAFGPITTLLENGMSVFKVEKRRGCNLLALSTRIVSGFFSNDKLQIMFSAVIPVLFDSRR